VPVYDDGRPGLPFHGALSADLQRPERLLADSENVRLRGQEEKFGHGIESRCRLAAMHYQPLLGVPGIVVRTYGTTLYNSLYRTDDQVLVHAHVWGVNAYGALVWHLRRTRSGGMFDTCADSFHAVWETARPVEG